MTSLLICIEISWRHLYPHQTYKRTFPGQFHNKEFSESSWGEYDKDLGWVFNKKHVIFGPRGITYKANRQGFRDSKDFYTATLQAGKKRIMVLGDSMVFGAFIHEENTIPELLQQDLGEHYLTYNLGICGWGTDQMYLAYKKYVPVIKPDIVVLFFIDDDILRSFEAFKRFERTNKPSFEINNGDLKLRNEKRTWVDAVIEKSYILNRLFLWYRDLYSKKLTKLIFDKMIQNNKQTKFLIVRIPLVQDVAKYGYLKNYQKFSFKGDLTEDNVVYIELMDYMKRVPKNEAIGFYMLQNGHFSEYGSAFVAQTIAKFCY